MYTQHRYKHMLCTLSIHTNTGYCTCACVNPSQFQPRECSTNWSESYSGMVQGGLGVTACNVVGLLAVERTTLLCITNDDATISSALCPAHSSCTSAQFEWVSVFRLRPRKLGFEFLQGQEIYPCSKTPRATVCYPLSYSLGVGSPFQGVKRPEL